MADEDTHDNDNDYEEKVFLFVQSESTSFSHRLFFLSLGQEYQHYCSTSCKQEVNKENPQACSQGVSG